MRRRGVLARLAAFLCLPLLPGAGAAAAPRTALHEGWVLTDRDLAEIARLDR